MIEKEKLQKIADSIKIPTFHARARQSTEDYLGDSFGAVSLRRIPDSLGSGLYVTSSLQDVIDWSDRKQEEYGEICDVYLYDLGDADDLLVFNTTDEMDDHTTFMGALTKYVLNDLVFETLNNKPFHISNDEFEEKCNEFCERYNLSLQDVKKWADNKKTECKQLTKNNDLFSRKSIATTFQEEVMHIKGLDASKTLEGDSVSLGSLVFEQSSIKPVYNFKDNTELAQYFCDLVCDKIMDRKLENIPFDDKEEVEYLAYWGTGNLNIDCDPKIYTEILLDKQKLMYYEQEISKREEVILALNSDVPLSKQMENVWNVQISEGKNIEWLGESFPPAFFEDIYLLQCKKEQIKPNQAISDHFWNNCVKSQGYKPAFNDGADRSSAFSDR